MPELTLALAVAALAVFAGAVVQGSVGFGVGLLAAPFLMWAVPDAMPGALIMLGGGMTLTTLAADWRWVDVRGLAWALVGRLPGAFAGAWLVLAVATDTLGVFVGLAVVAMAALQATRWAIRLSPLSLAVAGFVSGTTATMSGIGGPPVAMVYAGDDPRVVRGTLASYFFVGSVISLVTLAVVGRLGFASLAAALTLAPALLLGAWCSRRVARHLDRARLRAAILVVAAAAGFALVVTSLTGELN